MRDKQNVRQMEIFGEKSIDFIQTTFYSWEVSKAIHFFDSLEQKLNFGTFSCVKMSQSSKRSNQVMH